MTNKTIHWGMIGTGDVTEVKSGPGFYLATNSTLHGVLNRTKEKALDYARRHQVPVVYNTLEEMLADPIIDAVYIATPPGSHKEIAIACAKARKICYIEKPLALTYQDSLAITAAFKEHQIQAFVAYYRRSLPRFNKVKELLQQNIIGEIRNVNLQYNRPLQPSERDNPWRLQADISGGGLFMDMGVHQLDILDYLIAPIKAVHSITANQGGYYQIEDIVNLIFTFENGVQGVGSWCFTTGTWQDRISLLGSSGQLTFACFDDSPIIWEDNFGQQTTFTTTTPAHVQQPLIQAIVNELNGDGHSPSTLESALRTAWVCEQIYQKN